MRERRIQRRGATRSGGAHAATTPSIRGDELARLLAPLDVRTFLSRYWGKRPLHIRGGAAKLRSLLPGGFTRHDLERAVAVGSRQGGPDFELYAAVDQKVIPSRSAPPPKFPRIHQGDVKAALRAGSIIVNQVADARVATLAAGVKSQLGYPGACVTSATLSSKRHGLSTHIDASSSFIIQCEGRKRWYVSRRPVLAWPRDTAIIYDDGAGSYSYRPEPWEAVEGTSLDELESIVLSPGDVLFCPAGTIHATEAVGGTSLGLVLFMHQVDPFVVLTSLLKRKLWASPEWRHVPPVPLGAGRLPAEVRRFFAARIESLRSVLASLEVDSIEMERELRQFVVDPGKSTSAILPRSPGSSLPPEPDDVLRVSTRAPADCMTRRRGKTAASYLFAGKSVVEVDGEWAGFVAAIGRRREFVARQACRWAPRGGRAWGTVREHLAALLAAGIVERVES